MPSVVTRLFASFAAALLLTGTLSAAPPAAAGARGTTVGQTGTTAGEPAAPPTTPGAGDRKGKSGDRKAKSGDPLGTDLKSSDSDSVAARKIALEESKLEKRKAKIARLRELARAQGNEQRLRALDDLERRMIEGHERKTAKWRERLGDDRFGKVRSKVKQRKGQGKASGGTDRGKSADRGKPGGDGAPDDESGERGKSAGKAAQPGKPAERGKGSRERGAGEPKGQGGGKDAPGKARGQGKKEKGDKP